MARYPVRYLTHNEEITFELLPVMEEAWPYAFFHDFSDEEIDCSSLMSYEDFTCLCNVLTGVRSVTLEQQEMLYRLRMVVDSRLERWYKFRRRLVSGVHWCDSYEEYRLIRDTNMNEYIPCQLITTVRGDVIAAFGWRVEPLYTAAGDITESHLLAGRYAVLEAIIPYPRKSSTKSDNLVKEYMMATSTMKALTACINLYKSSILPPRPSKTLGGKLHSLELRQQATVLILAATEYPVVCLVGELGVSLGYIRL